LDALLNADDGDGRPRVLSVPRILPADVWEVLAMAQQRALVAAASEDQTDAHAPAPPMEHPQQAAKPEALAAPMLLPPLPPAVPPRTATTIR
jgi:hypothetical protein